ncbi:hypothetical protein E6O75_ATG09939 [Venturia nashicola]|uniref:Uncharacterized protein n=1 Tax=Venturia nashicola TaxID=86259 RepID=A0A4Z1NNJ1_9PEZI|nr:hypothetical protein E6O75_ATG09939 [Venturia nashicola]
MLIQIHKITSMAHETNQETQDDKMKQPEIEGEPSAAARALLLLPSASSSRPRFTPRLAVCESSTVLSSGSSSSSSEEEEEEEESATSPISSAETDFREEESSSSEELPDRPPSSASTFRPQMERSESLLGQSSDSARGTPKPSGMAT